MRNVHCPEPAVPTAIVSREAPLARAMTRTAVAGATVTAAVTGTAGGGGGGGGDAPEPVRVSVPGAATALLGRLTVPLAAPAVVGANAALIVQVAAGAMMAPLQVPPVSTKSPAMATDPKTTFASPVLVTVNVCEAPAVPSIWLPKSNTNASIV